MPDCAVAVCRNRSEKINFKTSGITYHQFPKSANLREQWIDATQRTDKWFPTSNSTICSAHFEENCFKPSTKNRRLFEWAVPTLKLRLVFEPPNYYAVKLVQSSTLRDVDISFDTSVAPSSVLTVQETVLPIENASTMETCTTVVDIKEEPLHRWEEYEPSSEEKSSGVLSMKRDQSQIADVPMITAIKQEPKNILIGVTGSVATIKLPLLIEKISQVCGHTVSIKVVSTANAFHFFKASDLPVKVYQDSEEWSAWMQRGDPVLHIDLTKWADLFLIAPLDANTLAKISQGFCDNLLTCVARAWPRKKPLVFCPAMNTQMWEHPVTEEHVSRLKRWQYVEVPCVSKTLMCGDTGMGAMAEVDTIASVVKRILSDETIKEVELPLEIVTPFDPLAPQTPAGYYVQKS